MGMFHSSNSARLMSWLFMDAFLIRIFTVCTAFLALPFYCAWVKWAASYMFELVLVSEVFECVA